MPNKSTIGFGPILLISFIMLASCLPQSHAADKKEEEASTKVKPQELRYTFSWNFDTESDLSPRGAVSYTHLTLPTKRIV